MEGGVTCAYFGIMFFVGGGVLCVGLCVWGFVSGGWGVLMQ